MVVVSVIGELTRTEEKEEPNGKHIGNGLGLGRGVGKLTRVLDKGDGDGLHFVWRGVSLAVTLGQIDEIGVPEMVGSEPGV